MKYYHDPEHKTVWAVPETPDVHERKETITKRRKHPKRIGWTVYAQIEETRADNWIKPNSQQWFYPVRHHPREHFDAHYTREDVIMYFSGRNLGPCGDEITAAEYAELKKKYEGIAESNRPPQ